ncbi:MAG TPA: YlxR family protein [Anaerolineae bacterium]|nr:YlxR family protein [Anaerolineae bacterium]HXV97033.1 YlxR family protein [Anaerolineae bacterium]
MITRPKHRPQRTCIACRETKDKRDLIRVVRTPEGALIIDPTGKANGRGAYLCRQASCWEKGLHKQRLSQALKVNLSTTELTQLQAQLQTEFSKV